MRNADAGSWPAVPIHSMTIPLTTRNREHPCRAMLCYEWALLAVGQHSDNMQTILGPEMFGGGGTFVIHTSSRLLYGIFEYRRCMWRVADEVCKSPNSYSLG